MKSISRLPTPDFQSFGSREVGVGSWLYFSITPHAARGPPLTPDFGAPVII